MPVMTIPRDAANAVRFVAERHGGHYESWFVRANHPSRPLALWIRYTIFAPVDGRAEGELWAIAFDGERDVVVAGKREVAIDGCRFARDRLDVAIAEARLDDDGLVGSVGEGERELAWDLRLVGGDAPILLLREPMYEGGFPKAKSLVPRPFVRLRGVLRVGDARWEIDDWIGSQNHNWGSRHTDRYAWAQVVGFDGAPTAFLECVSAKLKLGPIWTPYLSMAVLHVDERTYAFNTMLQAARARVRREGLTWSLRTRAGDDELEVEVDAPRQRFVALRYRNPPGGDKVCLNSKLARATVVLRRAGKPALRLTSEHGAAFELLDDTAPGFTIVA